MSNTKEVTELTYAIEDAIMYAADQHVHLHSLYLATKVDRDHANVRRDLIQLFNKEELNYTDYESTVEATDKNGQHYMAKVIWIPRDIFYMYIAKVNVKVAYDLIVAWEQAESAIFHTMSRESLEAIYSAAVERPVRMVTLYPETVDIDAQTFEFDTVLQYTTQYYREMTTYDIEVLCRMSDFIMTKRSDNILRDVRALYAAVPTAPAPVEMDISVLDTNGVPYQRTTLRLPKPVACTIMCHYDVRELYAIVKRWIALQEEDVSALIACIDSILEDKLIYMETIVEDTDDGCCGITLDLESDQDIGEQLGFPLFDETLDSEEDD